MIDRVQAEDRQEQARTDAPSVSKPTHEQDAVLTINGQHIHVTVEWEAIYQPGFPGNREEPAERAGCEIQWAEIKTPADWEDRLAEITEDLESTK